MKTTKLNHYDVCGTWMTPKIGQGTICINCKPQHKPAAHMPTPLEYWVICDTCGEDYYGGASLFTAKQRGIAHRPGHIWHIQAIAKAEGK